MSGTNSNEFEKHNINGYAVEIQYTYDGTELYISNPDGFEIFAHKVSGNPMTWAREIIAHDGGNATEFETSLLKTAQSQVLNLLLLESKGDGGRNYKAWEKAMIESTKNGTIKFDGEKLTFISRFSKLPRIVTKDGCSEQCSCKNQISYHQILFRIFERCQQLSTETKVRVGKFSKRQPKQIERLAA